MVFYDGVSSVMYVVAYLHFCFKVVLKHAVKLLDIVLHERLERVPAKALREFTRV